ncbi:hypothetical protein SISSUDRAFT_306677 [Sistotremastrum suecicum HHB10207 ss-3]|uniref:DNA recombination and repair protein Rad51-like C-terminal domain-containing protein n=1 Tax=Sistotremastrum suecicum HHB10207 ss-3 TaxID=1314776 RepID=A0A166G7Z3_9AGAM|nr:hypothetical protein SISSUDRAFT_306677 [Sistotremastrum suecicum HHB10207 ss-3]
MNTHIKEIRRDDKATYISPMRRGDVIEIQGPAATGKTHLLYSFAMKCVLPRVVPLAGSPAQDVFIGGWEKSAVVMNCDGRWSIVRFHALLLSHLAELLGPHVDSLPPGSNLATIAHECLTRIHLFHPTSYISLACTLIALPSYHATDIPNSEVGIVLIDSMSSFYWSNRAEGERNPRSPTPFQYALQSLQSFRISHGPVIVVTNWALNPLPPPDSEQKHDPNAYLTSTFFRQHLGRPYSAPFDDHPRDNPNARLYPPVNHHITLTYNCIPPLPNGLSLSETIAENESRQAVIDSVEITGYVRSAEAPDRVCKIKFAILNDSIQMMP